MARLAKSIIESSDGVCSSLFSFVGFDQVSNPSLAHVSIPLMHVGPNAKGLYWTPEVLKKIAPMFSNTTFKYDIGGKEGSSHVPDKLYSPDFDVGWTQKAYYDEKTETLWVEGDVTYPDVVKKIQRQTSDGKRELRYASMGVLIDPDDVDCSICHKKMVDCGHKRNEDYDGQTAYAVPTAVKKALHVALTNAPADTEAIIAKAIFQESRTLRGENMVDQVGANDSYTNQQSRPNTLKSVQVQPQQTESVEKYQKDNAGESMMTKNPTDDKFAKTNSGVGAMAGDEEMMAPATAPMGAPGEAGGDDNVELVDVIKALIMRVKAMEQELQAMKGGAAPQPGMGPEAAPAPAPSPMGAPPTEMADIAGKYHKKLLTEVADQSVRIGKYASAREAVANFADMSINQLETLSAAYDGINVPRRSRVETASMPEYGAPAAPAPAEKNFADMAPSERKAKYGEFASWDMCFR